MQMQLFLTRKRGCFYPVHIHGSWHQNKWSVSSGRAAWYLCNFWWLHFSAGQCTHRPIRLARRSRYCNDRFRLSLLQICDLTTAPTWTLLTTRSGVRCRTVFIGRRCETLMIWSSVWLTSGTVWSKDRPVAFTTSCLCPCKRRTFRTVFVTYVWTLSWTDIVLSPLQLNECLCFWQLSFHKLVQQHV